MVTKELTPTLETRLTYWQQQLAVLPALLELPTDRPRVTSHPHQKEMLSFPIDAHLVAQLKQLPAENALLTGLLTTFVILLQRYTHRDDLVVGAAIGQQQPAVRPLCLYLPPDPTVSDLMAQIQQAISEAQAHDLPLAEVLAALSASQNLAETPLFQVLFDLQTAPPLAEEDAPDFQHTPAPDLALRLVDHANQLQGHLTYNSHLFAAATITRLINHFRVLLTHVLATPEKRISRLPLLTEAERQQILVEWNESHMTFPQRHLCIHQLFEQQVAATPQATAVTANGQRLTYQQLNERANQVAHYLRRHQIGPNQFVAICTTRSLEMIISVLAVLKAGGAYLPIDPAYPLDRIAFMLSDSQVSVLLTESTLQSILPPTPATVIYLDTDGAKIAAESQQNPANQTDAHHFAYLMYTSGSTGQPKGVLITQGGWTNAYFGWEVAYELRPLPTTHLQMASFSFDMFCGDFVRALCSGGTLVICPKEILLEPAALYQLMRQEGVNCAEFVPAVLRNLMPYLAQTGQDLSFMKVLVVGGDVWYAAEFQTLLAYCGSQTRLIHSYGVAEATIDTAYFEVAHADFSVDRPLPIGKPYANMHMYVLDEHMNPVPAGVLGELYIGGAGVAAGYLNRPELTTEKFVPHPFSEQAADKLYKTGDLARYTADGNVEFWGRADNQVKIRGFRVELGEIESVLSQYAAVQESAVLAWEASPGSHYLAAYIVSDQAPDFITSLRHFLQENLPAHMVPTAFVFLETMPLTPNGKINRQALPEPDKSQRQLDHDLVPPQTPTQTLLATIWTDVLGVTPIGIHDNFFELGGHSLLVTQVIARIRETVAVALSAQNLFEQPTIAQLSHLIEQAPHTAVSPTIPAITPISRDAPLPLSFAQQRLWFLHQLDTDVAAYNIVTALNIKGHLDIKTLKASLAYLVQRHETLRTTFKEVEGEPVQIINPPGDIDFPVEPAETATAPTPLIEEAVQEEALHLFDLETEPLIRARLLILAPQQHLFILVVHHIISDGWSEEIMIQELFTIYEALSHDQEPALPPLPVQYADFAHWQRQWLQGDIVHRQLTYWQQHMAGAPPVLELPTDHTRPSSQTFIGRSQHFALDQALRKQLEALSRQSGTTLYMTMVAAFMTLLFRYSQQADIVIGTPAGNRHHREIESLIGFFVNTLVLRMRFASNPTFAQVLTTIRQLTLEAYAHQDLPFEQLVDALQPERNLSHNPLFQVMFAWQHEALAPIHLADCTVTPLPVENKRVNFDLLLSMSETETGLAGTWAYSTDLFEDATIDRLTAYFENLLTAVVTHPHQPITQLPFLPPSERHQLLVEWNQPDATAEAAPISAKCLHQLFEEQVQRTPHAIAVTCMGAQLTYTQLNQQANQLAHYLRASGVGPDVGVGICVERSLDMVVGVLGILKAGGAYVPADPEYPAPRIAHIFADANVALILTQQPLQARMPQTETPILCLDAAQAQLGPQPSHNPVNQTTPQNLIYTIYTSGTTGKPKGVLVAHQSVTNTALNFGHAIRLTPQDKFLQFSSISFDVCAQEMFATLLKGATLVIHPTLAQLSPVELRHFCQEQALTVLTVSVAFLQHWVDELNVRNLTFPPTIRAFLTGGESPSIEKTKIWANLVPPDTIFLLAYGPTEAAITTTIYQETSQTLRTTPLTKIPLGRPLPNTAVYLLDAAQQPVPIGVPGELHIGGVGVARGYLNDPQLTGQKFIVTPSGERVYKTGDLARYLADGSLEFLGRQDHQVKIRGFRIEPGEIEAVLVQHPHIQQAVVVVRQDHMGNKRLMACIIPEPQTDIHTGELRHWLGERLPDYMIPALFMEMEKFPLNTNGKIDHKALPGAEAFLEQKTADFVPPRTPTEKTLAAIWADVLATPQVGAYSHFFELGGHSLLATRALSRMRDAFDIPLPLRLLFEKPVVADLAHWIVEQQLAAAESDLLAEVLAEVDDLSDDEVTKLLTNL